MSNSNLLELTGLADTELSSVFESNPRAYMAVRGAVAEVHLLKHLKELLHKGVISDIKTAKGDMDKDFYITTPDGQKYCIECKNAEVIKLSSKSMIFEYIKYLLSKNLIDSDKFLYWCSETLNLPMAELSLDEALSKLYQKSLNDGLKQYHSQLDQSLRESGIEKYRFSASRIATKSLNDNISSLNFLSQFDDSLLSIDMQRTRNTQNESEGQKNRFYAVDEIDIVAVCLFSRTTKWEFVFTNKNNLTLAKKAKGRFHNIQKIDKTTWSNDLSEHLYK